MKVADKGERVRERVRERAQKVSEYYLKSCFEVPLNN